MTELLNTYRMSAMIYCKRCLYPENHPLGITFDQEGVCSGCRVHEEKYTLDWAARFQRLRKLVEGYKRTAYPGYDCIVPVSGARDSYFIVHTVKKVLGMNPLLVGYNAHYNTHMGIRNLAYLRTIFDCDYNEMIVAPQTVQRISRETMRKMASFHWHVLAGQTVWPVQVAVRLKIPLIIWGAHQGVDQVGMYSHEDEVEMSRKYRCDHDLMGVEAEDLVGLTENLREDEVRPYIYPSNREVSKVGVRGIYLGNYIPWDSKRQHEDMIEAYGYETMRLQRTFDTYNDVGCQHYSGYHDLIKFQKWGYGKALDHACRELRWGRLTRREAAEIVMQYQDVFPKDKKALLNWIGLSESEEQACINRNRDRRIWDLSLAGEWELNDHICNHLEDHGHEDVALEESGQSSHFVCTPSRNEERDNQDYVLIDPGYCHDQPAVTRK